jgi:DMSO reductase anchor subunit
VDRVHPVRAPRSTIQPRGKPVKPALSVILLTTLIGAGQGLFLAYYSAEWFVMLAILAPAQTDYSGYAAGLGFLLLATGLLASFFHLGHPERAWRAAAMWRSSWLSREVIALPVTMLLMLGYTLLKLGDYDPIVFVLGESIPIAASTLVGFAAVLALCALYVCTAMIYACLKFLRQWHSPLTVLNFILMGGASGFTLATAISAYTRDGRFAYFVGMAIFLTLAALVSRFASLSRNKNLRNPSSLQSAIGVHHPTIRQIAQGAMGGSFNTRTFIHSYGASVVRLARRSFLVLGFIVPVVLLQAGSETSWLLCAIAFVLQYLGLLVERWYFFIEAEHPQNIYYQMIS